MDIEVSGNRKKLAPLIFTDLIRIGNDFDGGYVLPRSSIDGVNTLISFGVGSNWTFESFIEKLLPTIKIYGFDHTVSLSYFFRKSINGLVKSIIKFNFSKHFRPRLNHLYRYIRFWIMNRNSTHLQIQITNRNVQKIVKKYTRNSGFGVKIDIEGGEFVILPEIFEYLQRANFLLIEFHDIEENSENFDSILNELLKFAVIAHMHCNNFDSIGLDGFPKTIELTFVNMRFATTNELRTALPLPDLDSPTARNREDFAIRF